MMCIKFNFTYIFNWRSGTYAYLTAFMLILFEGCSARILYKNSVSQIQGLSYPSNPANYALGQKSIDNTPTTSSGIVSLFSISPNLPAGLQFNSNTGTISGTPTAELASTPFTVTAVNTISSEQTTLTLSVHDFGNGKNGSSTVSSANTILNSIFTPLTSSAGSGSATLTVGSTSGFNSSGGEAVLIIQMQDYSKTGNLPWEFAKTASTSGLQISLTQGLSNSYSSSTSTFATSSAQAAQVILIPQYTDVTILSGGSITSQTWSAVSGTGGVVVFFANGTLSIQSGGKINTTGLGFSGGNGGFNTPPHTATGMSGESWNGVSPNDYPNGGGGGGASISANSYSAIAGSPGSHTSSPSSSGTRCQVYGVNPSSGITDIILSYGSVNLTGTGGGSPNIALGSGGSGSAVTDPSSSTCGGHGENGSSGGGIVMIYAKTMGVNGQILAQGNPASKTTACNCNSGGPGAGGSIYLHSASMNLGTNSVMATAGASNADTTSGLDGRIQLDYVQLTGQTSPLPEYILNGLGVF